MHSAAVAATDPLALAVWALAALALLIAAVALSDRRHRRSQDTGAVHGCALPPAGWRGWRWDEPAWDACWPMSPGQRILAQPLPEDDGYLIPLAWGRAMQAQQANMIAGLDFSFLHGGQKPPWAGFTL